MLFISFDVGVFNMAFCEAEFEVGVCEMPYMLSLNRMELHNIHSLGGPINDIVASGIKWLKTTFGEVISKQHPVTILIERQVPVNHVCTALSFTIQTYFTCMFPDNCNIVFVSANLKPIKFLHGKERKGCKSKEQTYTIINTWLNPKDRYACTKMINDAKKADDLCDTILQLVGYIESLPMVVLGRLLEKPITAPTAPTAPTAHIVPIAPIAPIAPSDTTKMRPYIIIDSSDDDTPRKTKKIK